MRNEALKLNLVENRSSSSEENETTPTAHVRKCQTTEGLTRGWTTEKRKTLNLDGLVD